MNKVSYALGMSVANNILASGVKDLNVEEFVNAVKAMLTNQQPSLTFEEAQQVLTEYFTKLQEEQVKALKADGEAFLAENAKKEGVVTLPSGLQYKVITEGNGNKPTANQQVKCHYEGTLINGAKFDSSYDRNEPAVFPVNGVIQGWVEALQLMPVGSKWELYIPYNLAYGERGAGQSIPPYATLIFTVELLEIL
ncbi:MAG: FKBP-type peptidyl-prolyl cis-trans isomerase [Bacteroidales bacterium]|nr:FKBP-type peptidyl-prolyl cis-trans isomerase [Bacteroidales bacterium]